MPRGRSPLGTMVVERHTYKAKVADPNDPGEALAGLKDRDLTPMAYIEQVFTETRCETIQINKWVGSRFTLRGYLLPGQDYQKVFNTLTPTGGLFDLCPIYRGQIRQHQKFSIGEVEEDAMRVGEPTDPIDDEILKLTRRLSNTAALRHLQSLDLDMEKGEDEMKPGEFVDALRLLKESAPAPVSQAPDPILLKMLEMAERRAERYEQLILDRKQEGVGDAIIKLIEKVSPNTVNALVAGARDRASSGWTPGDVLQVMNALSPLAASLMAGISQMIRPSGPSAISEGEKEVQPMPAAHLPKDMRDDLTLLVQFLDRDDFDSGWALMQSSPYLSRLVGQMQPQTDPLAYWPFLRSAAPELVPRQEKVLKFLSHCQQELKALLETSDEEPERPQ